MTYYKCGSVYTTQNSNVVVDTASGAVANFQTPLAMPLKSLTIGVNAKQESGTPTPSSPKAISGVSEINTYRKNRNLLAKPFVHFSKSLDSLSDMFFVKAGTYIVNFPNAPANVGNWRYALRLKDINGNNLSTDADKPESGMGWRDNTAMWLDGANSTRKYRVFTFRQDCYIRVLFGFGETSETTVFDNVQLEFGSTESTYEPYNGSTTLITLGGTYYGGYVTQDKDGKRELVVTHGVKLFSELDFRRSNSSGSWISYVFFAQMSDKTNISAVKCSNYDYVRQSIASMQNETITSGSSNEYIYIRDDNYTDVPTFKTANANTQLLYELAEPFTVALPDGQPIKSLPGINNIFADTGDMSLQFRKIG